MHLYTHHYLSPGNRFSLLIRYWLDHALPLHDA
jgi:hypothetical protein